VPSALVVGAGIFGSALADRLVLDGWDVTLVDVFEPGDPRAESGGETRMLRFAHGEDAFYTQLAYRARTLWRELGAGVLIESAVVWFAHSGRGWEADSEEVLRAAGVPVERITPGETERLFPSLRVDDLEFGLLEPEAGVLRAGDGVRALVARAREGGLRLERALASPAGETASLPGGRRLEADHVIWACGAWLARLFPTLAPLRVTRQDVCLFDAPAEWAAPAVPGWLDFDTSFYGHALVEPHGFKVTNDREGPPVDPDARPAEAGEQEVEHAREYLGHRFPALAGTRLRSAPVCHYSLTADANFLFARHPEHEGVWLLGGGSGHGYKHGPAIAEHVAAVLRGEEEAEPRYGLAPRIPSRALRTAGS
jgi:glycine/D-amino acid oxidase-like deaminating enzyme